MELLHRVCGPVATNVYVLGDEASREAIAIDTATPSVDWLTGRLEERGWTLKLVVSTHRHWDHIGDNAAVVKATGATLAAHVEDRHGLVEPQALFAPFPIVPSVPALDLAEGSVIRFGEIRLEVLHTPGHTEGSVCLLARGERLLLSGDTLFRGGWGRVDLPGASPEAMVESLTRLATLDPDLRVMPGHGQDTTIERERPWLEMVAQEKRLLL
ncbi:MAG: hydroxyacylglutathione hydrolase [Chloroflexota bacterium]|jgi:glyoxylase-like metal-dependent hydrolase (beta-lactamase superfamily II)|nr:hydroxyacylglutathione hydrolase [Chloroflexota bacterium]